MEGFCAPLPWPVSAVVTSVVMVIVGIWWSDILARHFKAITLRFTEVSAMTGQLPSLDLFKVFFVTRADGSICACPLVGDVVLTLKLCGYGIEQAL